MFSGLYNKKLSKMLKISSFFAFQSNSVFEMIEQAELNRAFFARYCEPSRAELFGRHGEPSRAFFSKSSSQKRAEPSFGSDPTLLTRLLFSQSKNLKRSIK